MIWFGNLPEAVAAALPGISRHATENARMEHALRWVSARSPQLAGGELADAIAETGLIDRDSAIRLLPLFSHFDRDRHFSESLRSLSFRGPSMAGEFRTRILRVMQDLTETARVGAVGPEEGVRFSQGDHEGVVLAYPQVAFTLGGSAMQAVAAAVEEMPDALVIVARNFQPGTAQQLAAILERSEVPGTLITVNLLLGLRAVALRYQPPAQRVAELLGVGRPLRSQDIALLGNRA